MALVRQVCLRYQGTFQLTLLTDAHQPPRYAAMLFFRMQQSGGFTAFAPTPEQAICDVLNQMKQYAKDYAAQRNAHSTARKPDGDEYSGLE